MPAKSREILLNGRLRTADAPSTIGESDFSELTNFRYNDSNPRGIGGMSKLNATQTPNGYRYIHNGMNFRKGYPGESHILVSGDPSSSNLRGRVYRTGTARLTTAIDNDDTTIVLSSGDYFAEGDYVVIDSEIIILGAETAGSFASCTRGAMETSARSHGVDTVVMHLLSDKAPFNTTYLWEDSVGCGKGRFSHAPQGTACYCNGIDSIVWGGEEYRCASFVIDASAAFTAVYDYTEQVTNTRTDTDQLATVQTYNVSGTIYRSYWYIGSVMPISGFKVYLGTANVAAGTTLGVKYWDGTASPPAWASVNTLVDNTIVSGSTLGQTGFVTWTYKGTDQETKEAKKFVEKRLLYWYQVTVEDSNENFNPTKISYVTTVLPAQQIKDLWDQNERACASFVHDDNGVYNDLTINVADNTYSSSESYSYAAFAATTGFVYNEDALYIGFVDQTTAIRFNIPGDKKNTTNTAITVSYWNGTAWAAVAGQVDQTTVGSAAFQQSGYVYWKPPALNVEQKRSFTVSSPKNQLINIPLYYYKITLSATPTVDWRIYYVTGASASIPITGYSFSEMHQNRLCLFDNVDGRRNSFRVSMYRTLNVFNGSDAYEFLCGNDEPLVCAAPMFLRHGSLTSDLLVILKNGETWGLGGYGTAQDPFSLYRISTVVGCVAPDTLVSVPLGDLENPGQTKQVLVWQARQGIVIFDGINVPVEISNDIRDLFDIRSANYITDSVAHTCSGFYDPVYHEYHWVIPGVAEYAFDLKRKKWYKIDRGANKYLVGGFMGQDPLGNSFSVGFDSSGYCYLLEDGNTFDGNAIVHTLKTADIALEGNSISIDSWFRGYKIVCKDLATDGSVTVKYYPDSATTGADLTAFSPNISTYGLCQHVEMARGGNVASGSSTARMGQSPVYHALKFTLSTDDQSVGFEPLVLALYYEVTQPDIWGRMSN